MCAPHPSRHPSLTAVGKRRRDPDAGRATSITAHDPDHRPCLDAVAAVARPVRAKVAFRGRDLGGLLAPHDGLTPRVASESLVGASITWLARVDADPAGAPQLERT